jgi:hypothetical protein
MKRTALLAAGLITSLVVLAAEPLNVKTGQWEITTLIQSHGMPPIPEEALAKMPPEQREKLLAMFASRNGAPPKEHKSTECVTKEDLAKPFHPSEDEKCETTVVKSTGTTQDISVVCKGDHPSTGRMHIEASSPEAMKGTIDIALAGGKDAMQIKTQLSGRWIGPTCKKND